MSSVDTPGTPSSPTSQPISVSIEMMLYEAGMIANSLSSKSLGGALAQRLADEEHTAEEAEQSSFTFAFSPFEAGMALNGMSRSEDGSLDDVKHRLSAALSAKMQELGINPLDGGSGSLNGQSSPSESAPLADGSTPPSSDNTAPDGDDSLNSVPDATGNSTDSSGAAPQTDDGGELE